jgi:4-hydroxy-2-oxoheptanedioate aldolase
MQLQRNTFKRALAEKRLQIGLWCSLTSNIAAEIVADSGFDWLLLDSEHAPNEIPGLLSQLQAVRHGPAAPVVRVAWNDLVLIKRTLDIGAQSLLVPLVDNAEQAQRAVRATRYPPVGNRGVAGGTRATNFGRVDNYLTTASEEICVVVQAETRGALDRIEEIAKVEGIDGVFIGPNDLAASLGHTGNTQHPEVQQAIQDAGRRLRAAGKAAGILAFPEEEARRYIGWGYSFVAVGGDVALLANGADALARKFKA